MKLFIHNFVFFFYFPDCAGSVSDRTLHSLALTTGAAQLGTRGPSTPEYVKRTARLFESSTTPTEETSTTPTNESHFANSTTNLAPANEQFLQVCIYLNLNLTSPYNT